MSSHQQWKIFLLMDHREFLNSKNNFAPRAKAKIDNHFSNKHPVIDAIHPEYCIRTTLISGDYMFIARQFDDTGSIIDERVLDLVVERKSVDDLQGCLIKKSKTCAPLSFFEAQMYKLQQTPGNNRIFLMEGDEDKPGENGISQVGNPGEWVLRRKRVKTMRNQINGDEWKGVKLVCTTDKNHSVQYLVDRMAEFMKEGFDPTKLHLYHTMEQFKQIVNERMKEATFLEYLRLRSIKGTGDVTAMKAIRNPDGPWDKDFISPACISRDKKYKSNLEDRAVYYVSNNIGGMSKMGNAILSSQTSSSSAASTSTNARKPQARASLPKDNHKPTAQTPKNASATSNKSGGVGCKKCLLQEMQSGQKNNLRHDADCPKKKTTKRQESSDSSSTNKPSVGHAKRKYTSNDSENINQYKKKTKVKPTEPIYYNPNPVRRTSILGSDDIYGDLISSMYSTRRDLTGGSGLGVGGFEFSTTHTNVATAKEVASRSLGARNFSQSSSSSDDNSTTGNHSTTAPAAAAATRKSNTSDDVIIELDSPDPVIAKSLKSASSSVHAAAANDVIVLDDSDEEVEHREPSADEVEVIEID